MKKIIGILYESEFNEKSFETGCGGSETWAIQISKKFIEQGYHVIIFNNLNNNEISNSGVDYISIDLFEHILSYVHFNYFIFVRDVGKYYDILVNNNGSDHIYVQSHDMFIWKNGLYNEQLNWIDDHERFDKIDKFIALTNFHKEELHEYNRIPYEMITVIGNGLDSDIYDKVFNEYGKETLNTLYTIDSNHVIFWPSIFSRGGDILVKDIFPLVKAQCDDAKIWICGYADLVPEYIKNIEGVEFLGMISKEEYYKRFFNADCWFYPCIVPEDFGICAAEAIMCYCDVISTFKHGMNDILGPYKQFAIEYDFGDSIINRYHYSQYNIDKNSKEYKLACQRAASMILESFKTHGNEYKKLWKETARQNILKIYSWDNIVNKWKLLFLENYQ